MSAIRNVLLTGGAGFIGSHVLERLLGMGVRVTVLDDFNSSYDPRLKRANIASARELGEFDLIEGDLTRPLVLERTFSRGPFDTVLHFAALAGVRPSLEHPVRYEQVNVQGTLQLLEKVKQQVVSGESARFILASSSSVYGADSPVPFSEDRDVARPVSPYAATKRAAELHAFTYHDLYRIPTSCLRFFTVYGPRQRPEMAIHRFVRKVLEGEAIQMFGNGGSARDYTYIDDIVDGIIAALGATRGYEIFNLGGSRAIRLDALIEMIGHACGREPRLERLPDQPGDVPITFADPAKSKRLLGFVPKVPIEEGLRRFVAWYRSRRASIQPEESSLPDFAK